MPGPLLFAAGAAGAIGLGQLFQVGRVSLLVLLTFWLAAALQKTFVEVNEEGTEAAAATDVGEAGADEPEPPPVFRADHPFVFLIRDAKSGSVLFVGRVANPVG